MYPQEQTWSNAPSTTVQKVGYVAGPSQLPRPANISFPRPFLPHEQRKGPKGATLPPLPAGWIGTLKTCSCLICAPAKKPRTRPFPPMKKSRAASFYFETFVFCMGSNSVATLMSRQRQRPGARTTLPTYMKPRIPAGTESADRHLFGIVFGFSHSPDTKKRQKLPPPYASCCSNWLEVVPAGADWPAALRLCCIPLETTVSKKLRSDRKRKRTKRRIFFRF